MPTYYIALVDGFDAENWHIMDEFEAASHDEAEKYAVDNWSMVEWYLLDANKKNINSW